MKRLAFLILALVATEARADRIVPSAARAAGRNNAFFQTDLRLLNTSSTDAVTATLIFYPAGGGSPVQSSELRLEPRRQMAFNNVIETLFGFSSDTQGPIRVIAPDFVEVSTRTYNVNDPCTGGTLGSWIPGLLTSEASSYSVIPHAAGSENPAIGYRTNVLVANPSSDTAANVTVTLRSGEGSMLGSPAPLTIEPNSVVNRDVFLLTGSAGQSTDNAFIEISADRPVLAISSVIDNRTNDSAVFLAVPTTSPATLVRIGDAATFSGSYGVSGKATITSSSTIRVTDFRANGTAPGMDLRVGLASGSRRDFRVLRVLGRQSFGGVVIDLTLPEGIDLNSFDTFTVWCFEFNVLIAEGRFRTP